MDLIKLAKEVQVYEANKKSKDTISMNNPYKLLSPKLVEKFVDRLGDIEAKRNVNKYSASDTMQNADREIQAIAKILYYAPRTALLNVKRAPDEPTLGSLTPIFLYAQKKHNGIQYEDWDKTDPSLPFLLGHRLCSLVDFTIPKPEYNISELRIEAKVQDPVGYRLSKFHLDEDVIIYGNTLEAHMILQTWLANMVYRKPGIMILDPWNWDNVPSAVDEIEPDIVEQIADLPPWMQ